MYLVAASGTIGLEHREDMCRLEFSVYLFGHVVVWRLEGIE